MHLCLFFIFSTEWLKLLPMKKLLLLLFSITMFSQTTPPVMLWEEIYDVIQTPSNSLCFNSIVLGSNSNEYILTSNTSNIKSIFKMDTDGNLVWQKNAPINVSDPGSKSVALLPDNLYYTITKNCPESVQNSIQQFDNEGNMLGNWCLTNSENDSSYNYIISTNDGGLLISTTTTLKKFNSSKVLEWGVSHTTSSILTNIMETSDGYFIGVGSVDYNTLGNPYGGCYIVKYDALGNLIWQTSFGTVDSILESAFSVAELSNGNYIVNCYTNSVIDNDFFIGTWMYTVNPLGNVLDYKILPIFGAQSYSNIVVEDRGYVIGIINSTNGETTKFRLLKVNEANEIEWDVTFTDGWIYDLTKTPEGDYIAVGSAYNPSIWGSGNLKAMKIGWEPLATPGFENNISLYPNPAQNWLTVKNNFTENQTVLLYNITGQTIMKQEINQNENRLDVAKLQSGIYFLHLPETNTTLKWIKE